jgi:hypothetical protein
MDCDSEVAVLSSPAFFFGNERYPSLLIPICFVFRRHMKLHSRGFKIPCYIPVKEPLGTSY